jgi:hypothetical protein
MTTAYATPRDVYDLGLTARAFVASPRALDGRAGDFLDHTTGTISLIGHGLAADDLVRLVLVAAGGSLPGGASATAVYSPIPLDFWRFQLAAAAGGAAVTFSNAGTTSSNGASAWGIQLDPERRIERVILAVSADIDQDLTAHAAPIEPDPQTGRFPDKLVGIVARIAARRLIAGMQFENPAFRAAAERLTAEEKRDDEQRAAWRLGQQLLPTPIDQTDGEAEMGMVAGSGALARCSPRAALCWQRGRL